MSDLEKSGASAEPSPRGKELVEQQIVPNLKKLQDDDDVDVRYFAVTAGQKWEGGIDRDVSMQS